MIFQVYTYTWGW